MHILQWIATKADNEDEAWANVDNYLEEALPEIGSTGYWFDWYVVGGGRYNVTETDDLMEAYKGGKTNMFISSDNLEAFNEQLNKCIEYRIAEYRQYQQTWNSRGIDINEKLDTYTGNMEYDFGLYPLKKMIEMWQGDWDYNSYFYDMDNSSTNPMYVNNGIADNERWFLVPVDFHY